MNVASDWWKSFFDGLSVDLWMNALSPQYSEQEADRIAQTLNVRVGSDLLDVPCGAGRISLPLAARGYRVTGVDLSPAFLRFAREADAARSVSWHERDMRDLPWRNRFDGAFCVGNSFGYLDDAGNAAFLTAVAAALKPGAPFFLETPMVVESLLRTIKDRLWVKAGDVYLLVTNQYDASRSRLDIEYTFIAGSRTEVRRGTHRAYTYRELVELIRAAGFSVEPAAPWTIDTPTLSLIARRLGSQ